METTKNKSNSKIKALLLIIAIFSFLIFTSSIILHLTPLGMLNYVEDFAVHHYFLMGFISIVTLAASVKAYTSLDEKIDYNYRVNHSIALSKNRRKRLKLLNLFNGTSSQTNENESTLIKINEVSNLNFAQVDVLLDENAKLLRHTDLQNATVLGNSFKQKVIILFKDKESKKHLITTVWQCTSDHISLKGGITLPLKSIYKVEI